MQARAYNRRRIGGVMSEAEKHAYTLPLADVRATLERVGGKGASLARLVRAGLPVPDGFHVTTTAYRDFVDANNIQALIESALHPVDVKQPHTLEAASEQLRSAFARGAWARPWSAGWSRPIRSCWTRRRSRCSRAKSATSS